MPTYEYACPDCATKFNVRASFSEKEKGLKPVCPKCGSKDTVQVFGSVMILARSRGSSPPCCPGGDSKCCDQGEQE